MKRVADCDATRQLLQDVVQSIKKEQGRPYRIVNTNAKRKIKRGGRVVTETVPVAVEGWNGLNNEGFDTEEQAKASYRDLKVLVVKLLQKASENPTDSTAIALLRDLTHHTPRYEIVGPPGQHERRSIGTPESARGRRGTTRAEIANKRRFEDSDRHGSQGEISGGWGWKLLENVAAAHDAAAGGCGETVPPARRSRGNGFRCFGMIGNGPDPFDKFDGSADTADTYLDSRLSDARYDIAANAESNPSFCTGGLKYDDALGFEGKKFELETKFRSAEDRTLPSVPGLYQPKLEYTKTDYRAERL